MRMSERRFHVRETYRKIWTREINGRRFLFMVIPAYQTLPGYVKVFIDLPQEQRYVLVHHIEEVA
jgi:hypothetical protein